MSIIIDVCCLRVEDILTFWMRKEFIMTILIFIYLINALLPTCIKPYYPVQFINCIVLRIKQNQTMIKNKHETSPNSNPPIPTIPMSIPISTSIPLLMLTREQTPSRTSRRRILMHRDILPFRLTILRLRIRFGEVLISRG